MQNTVCKTVTLFDIIMKKCRTKMEGFNYTYKQMTFKNIPLQKCLKKF